jgi:hypothetical protein
MKTTTEITQAISQASIGKKVKVSLWTKSGTRVYVSQWNGSKKRPWMDAGYISIDGDTISWKGTLDVRNDNVENFANDFSAELAN